MPLDQPWNGFIFNEWRLPELRLKSICNLIFMSSNMSSFTVKCIYAASNWYLPRITLWNSKDKKKKSAAFFKIDYFCHFLVTQGIKRSVFQTRILVTHNLTLLPQMDLIIVMGSGRVAQMGTYQELLSKTKNLANLLQVFSEQEKGEDTMKNKQCIFWKLWNLLLFESPVLETNILPSLPLYPLLCAQVLQVTGGKQHSQTWSEISRCHYLTSRSMPELQKYKLNCFSNYFNIVSFLLKFRKMWVEIIFILEMECFWKWIFLGFDFLNAE